MKIICNMFLLSLSMALSLSCMEAVSPSVEEIMPSDKQPVGEEQVVVESVRFVNSMDDIDLYKNETPSDFYGLKMVKNEFESFQAVVGTVDNRPLDLEIEVDDPAVEIRMNTIEIFEKVQDVLVPCVNTVVPKENKIKFWINVYAGNTAKPGHHTASVVLKNGFHRYTFAIDIDVMNVALPVEPQMASVFAIEPDLLMATADKSAVEKRKLQTAELLLQYRISPYFCKWKTGTVYCSSSPYEYGDPRFWDYLKDKRFSRIALPSQQLNDAELEQMLGEARTNGLLPKSYFYVWDEPRMEAHYAELREYSSRIHKFAPDAKVLTTFFRGSMDGPHKDDFYAVFDFLNDCTSIYCTSAWALHNSEAAAAKCRESLAPGKEWWSYVCMGTIPGLAHLSGGTQRITPAENRIVMWRNWKEQNTGFLYWAVNSYASVYPMRFRPELPSGDGVLVYPGEPFGYDGICSSIRLERWKDGAEDCEMLMMIEKKEGRQKALDILSKVYTSPASYKQSSKEILSFRQELLESLNF